MFIWLISKLNDLINRLQLQTDWFFLSSQTKKAKQSESNSSDSGSADYLSLFWECLRSLDPQSSKWMTCEMRNSRCYFLQGNTEAEPLLHPVWWPSAQQGSWKDFKGLYQSPAGFMSSHHPLLLLCRDCWGCTVTALLNCSFTSKSFLENHVLIGLKFTDTKKTVQTLAII